jgi:hypothetical protein
LDEEGIKEFVKYILTEFVNEILYNPMLSEKMETVSGGKNNIGWMELWLFVILEYWLEKNGIK